MENVCKGGWMQVYICSCHYANRSRRRMIQDPRSNIQYPIMSQSPQPYDYSVRCMYAYMHHQSDSPSSRVQPFRSPPASTSRRRVDRQSISSFYIKPSPLHPIPIHPSARLYPNVLSPHRELHPTVSFSTPPIARGRVVTRVLGQLRTYARRCSFSQPRSKLT